MLDKIGQYLRNSTGGKILYGNFNAKTRLYFGDVTVITIGVVSWRIGQLNSNFVSVTGEVSRSA